MGHFVYAILLLVAIIVAILLRRNERRAKERVARECDAIRVEERRMFSFLRGLGEKLQADHSVSNLHRFVVDGVAEVVKGDAGVLYLLDGETGQLVPVYQSAKTCPVLPVPIEVLAVQNPVEAENQYRSFIRLSALQSGDSFLCDLVRGSAPLCLEDLSQHTDFVGSENEFQAGARLLAAPLTYANKHVGVLAVSRQGGDPFSENDEEVFGSVAEQSSFALGSAIIHAEAAEKRRFERELTQASEIQRVLLPRSSPELMDYDIAAEYRAARLVSGDYYDYVRVDEDRYGIAIGDVCGNGIAASLIMAMCRSNLRSRAPENLSPASVLHSVNGSIFPDIREDMFVSLLYLILERGSNEVTMARAGHEPPILYRRATGKTEVVETSGLAAGIDEGPVFKRAVKDFRFKMESGDILVLYTDGLIESENKLGDEFGIDRLCELIVANCDRSSQDVVNGIMEDVALFCEGMAQTDDITLIAIEKR
ncbi:MAG: SpoIIE family protein phosphatase [Verrucomicrobiales bacterium]|jgi:sigma-B regulation protein RsbU (phosphoserine phosphatase)|nr:SpoIIE family protein phosphatase [Verrucomicrobiales bacterium]MBP9222447.1 SpoIIE family protein phosphatase [Verrucomicrobiales bacterium]